MKVSVRPATANAPASTARSSGAAFISAGNTFPMSPTKGIQNPNLDPGHPLRAESPTSEPGLCTGASAAQTRTKLRELLGEADPPFAGPSETCAHRTPWHQNAHRTPAPTSRPSQLQAANNGPKAKTAESQFSHRAVPKNGEGHTAIKGTDTLMACYQLEMTEQHRRHRPPAAQNTTRRHLTPCNIAGTISAIVANNQPHTVAGR